VVARSLACIDIELEDDFTQCRICIGICIMCRGRRNGGGGHGPIGIGRGRHYDTSTFSDKIEMRDEQRKGQHHIHQH
jgi:hypothetical protein